MLFSLRKNSLISLFKEVRIFKECGSNILTVLDHFSPGHLAALLRPLHNLDGRKHAF